MEFIGYFYYYDLWPVYFKVLDILPIAIACLYGFVPGLICLIPAAVSECLWILSIHAPGPAINLASFVIINVAVGYLTKRIIFEGKWAKLILFEAALLGLRGMMCLFRYALSMKTVELTDLIFSVPNLVFAALLLCLLHFKSETDLYLIR